MLINQRGIIRFFFALVLVFIGVLIWLFWQGNAKNFYMKAVKFDNGLCEILVANGIDDTCISEQSRTEKKAGMSTWIEYSRKIKLPKASDLSKISTSIEGLAKNSGLEYSHKDEVNSRLIEVKHKNRLFSKTVFFQALVLPLGKKAKSRRNLVAIVIDDLGYKEDISGFLELGIPINLAILPKERYSKQIALKLNTLKIPFIMHLPMEPDRYPVVDPGAYALLLKMSDAEIGEMFMADLQSLPGASGFSNHMGSAFTANEEKMNILMKYVKKQQDLFFLDSYTTSKSKAKKAANEQGVKNLRNDIFIDLKDEPEFMNKQFDAILKKVKKHGQCIAIGHYQRKYMIPVIKENIERFKDNGIEFVYLKDLFNN